MPGGRPFAPVAPAFFSLPLPLPLSPVFKDVHVSPPSRETYRSDPGPPLVISHGRRCVCQNPANTIRGLLGSMHTSDAPVSSFLNSTRSHVLPLSFVR